MNFRDLFPRRSTASANKAGATKRKGPLALAKTLATEPGLAMIGAHVLFSAAAGGLAFGLALSSLVVATGLKVAQKTGAADKIKTGLLKNFVASDNAPMRTAGAALVGLSALSFMGGLPLLGTAFALFGSGNMIFNTPLTKKFPIDNVLFTAGSAITAFIAGGSLITSALIGAAGSLSVYNLIKPEKPDVNRNTGRPKLWFAAAQGASAVLGFMSGQPSRLLPSLALCSVTWGYIAMEGRTSGWFETGRQGAATENGDSTKSQNEPYALENNLRPHPARESETIFQKIRAGHQFTLRAEFSPETATRPQIKDQKAKTLKSIGQLKSGDKESGRPHTPPAP